MKSTRWMVLSLLACLALGCGDASDEELTDETSDDSAPIDVASPDPDPCADAELGDGDSTQDGVSSVSGDDMGTEEAALAAYARLREASSCTVKLTRRGKDLNITYEIK